MLMHRSLAGSVHLLSHIHEHDSDTHRLLSHQHCNLTHISKRHLHGLIHASHSHTRAQPDPPPLLIVSRHPSSSMLYEFHHYHHHTHPIHNHNHRVNGTSSPSAPTGMCPIVLCPPTLTSTVRHRSHSPHQHHISHSHSSLSLHSALPA